ncbi:DUF6277 family protein [Pantoea sp. NPDC088449]|jgi:hypothetical protein|uniref:Uncharacterized protein n=1 Tax=Candidatus Pantoea floridensis TaxID=1938870 RepID=A0A286DMD8_9GAMM|nr:DUF6277 family protein [Pantoea floridensis]PIF14749.1 hypothetical protein BX596_3849 [Enterobacteriaceae bacterium JKS000233]SOD59654.1 hypothetical protein SAMN06273570_4365 [Pantoea floridensis]HBZ15512.1 hypothetical protein [Pantoea sp.]
MINKEDILAAAQSGNSTADSVHRSLQENFTQSCASMSLSGMDSSAAVAMQSNGACKSMMEQMGSTFVGLQQQLQAHKQALMKDAPEMFNVTKNDLRDTVAKGVPAEEAHYNSKREF